MAKQPSDWNGRLRAAQSAISALPISIGCWGKVAYLGQPRYLQMVSNTTDGDGFWLRLSNASNKIGFAASANGINGANWVEPTATVSAGNWYHSLGVAAATNDRRVYLNGGNKNTTSNTVSGQSSLNQIHLGGYSGNSWDGPLQEFAVWNVALGDIDALMLGAGFRARLIRPQNLVMYFPLIRDAKCLITGIEMTLQNGTVNTVAHGAIF